MALIDDLRKRLVNSIDLTRNLSDQDVYEIITKMVIDEYRDKQISLKEKMRISKELYNSIRGLDILQDLLEDEEVTEDDEWLFSTMEYTYLEFDDHGNWTRRTAKYIDAAVDFTDETEETRTIEYYE